MLQRRAFTLTFAAAAAGLLGGCIVVPAGRPYVAAGGEVIATAPPELQPEVVAVAPGPGYFWIGGYWNWYGGRYSWVPGRWEAHRPGYRWAPHQWRRDGNGWRAAPGHWERH